MPTSVIYNINGAASGGGVPETPVDDGTGYLLQPRSALLAAEMVGYFLGQYYEQPVITAYVEGILEVLEPVEEALIAMRSLWALPTAEGVWLDQVGEDVGEHRMDRLDPEYRTAIYVRILVNRNQTTWDELLTILLLLWGSTPALVYGYAGGNFGAEAEVRIEEDSTGHDVVYLNSVLQKIRPNGGALHLITWPEDAAEEVFQLADADVIQIDAALGLADELQTTGGQLATIQS